MRLSSVMFSAGWCVIAATAIGLSGCASQRTIQPAAPVVARFYVESTGTGSPVVNLPQSGLTLHIAPRPVFSEYDIVRVDVAQVELGKCLLFQLTPSAARDLYRISVAHHGSRLVLFLNGVAVGARRMETAIDDGALAIFVEQPDGDLPAVVAGIRQVTEELAQARRKAGA